MTTFALISFTWIFFRAGSLRYAFKIISQLFSVFNLNILFDGSIAVLGKWSDWTIILVSIIILAVVDFYKYKKYDVINMLLKQQFWFRYLIYAGLFFSIILWGCYGEAYDAQQFIYFQF